jgi:hypothetical protein
MAKRDAIDVDEKETSLDKCDPSCDAGPRDSGPPREAGGTTGAGNLSPGQASRTGGATEGVSSHPDDRARARNVPPSA